MQRVTNRRPSHPVVTPKQPRQPAGSLQKLGQKHLLREGARGAEVLELQKILKRAGWYSGPVDGQFGKMTREAVKAYQFSQGLKVDGVVGQQTWGATMGLDLPPGSRYLGRGTPQPTSRFTDGFDPAPLPPPPPRGRISGRTATPEALRAYGNGRIPRSALTPIGIGGHRLYAPAAQAFQRMRADAARAGVNIGVTDSYRSYEQQVDLARRKGLYKNGGLAATPGTSKHGWGVALDIDVNRQGLAWMRANAARYGFAEAVPREPWHWEFRG